MTFFCTATPLFVAHAQPLAFKKTIVHQQFLGEGAGIGDFDKDGVMDIASGPYYYRGPTFDNAKRVQFYDDGRPAGGWDPFDVSGNFATFPHDVNGDGWTDIISMNAPGKAAAWYENPRGKAGLWARRQIHSGPYMEHFVFGDITGDGRPEVLAAADRKLGYLEADPTDINGAWRFRAVTTAGVWGGHNGPWYHGLGFADINGDGRADLLESTAWWEQPASLDGAPVWTKRAQTFKSTEPDPNGSEHDNAGCSHMFAYDIDGDGDNDVVTSVQAHAWGLAWFEQVRNNGQTSFVKHTIMGTDKEVGTYGVAFSQAHALAVADMDGDGLLDLVTGKSYWAHPPNGIYKDPDIEGTPVVYVFRLQRTAGGVKFVPERVDNMSGTGRQFAVGDVNADGAPDIVIGNKKGLFVFTQTNVQPRVADAGVGADARSADATTAAADATPTMTTTADTNGPVADADGRAAPRDSAPPPTPADATKPAETGTPAAGCACDVGSRPNPAPAAMLAALGVAALIVHRRRR